MKLYRYKQGQVYCRVAETLVGWVWEAVAGLATGGGTGTSEEEVLHDAERWLYCRGVHDVVWETII
jgi:hypothetical protein